MTMVSCPIELSSSGFVTSLFFLMTRMLLGGRKDTFVFSLKVIAEVKSMLSASACVSKTYECSIASSAFTFATRFSKYLSLSIYQLTQSLSLLRCIFF